MKHYMFVYTTMRYKILLNPLFHSTTETLQLKGSTWALLPSIPYIFIFVLIMLGAFSLTAYSFQDPMSFQRPSPQKKSCVWGLNFAPPPQKISFPLVTLPSHALNPIQCFIFQKFLRAPSGTLWMYFHSSALTCSSNFELFELILDILTKRFSN